MAYINMHNIVKTFPNVKAIDKCTISINKGEIFSLIGENGAGKSTMMKILYGLFEQDSGIIEIDGEIINDMTPHKAIAMGVGMVHQEFMLVPEFTVLENIILGFEPEKSFKRIDFKKARDTIDVYVNNYSLDVPTDKQVKNISVGQAQRVEIIKTLYRGANILILDEPTAVLTPSETEKLFEILRSLRDDGKTIIFISHKLNEVLEISDRICVMRRGQHIGTVNKEDVTAKDLARMMVGRDVLVDVKRECGAKSDNKVLDIKDLKVIGRSRLSTIKGLSLHVCEGEIVGIAGVTGNGQSELVEAISGLRHTLSGTIELFGKDITNKKPLAIRKAGLSHIPEDRGTCGINKAFDVATNMLATNLDNVTKRSVLNREKIHNIASEYAKKYDVRPNNVEIGIGTLSGGNAQKVIVAREIEFGGKFLIAAQPTRGVDIGAIESIRNIIAVAKAEGSAILLVSADLDEIIALSDRIIVMHEGTISGEIEQADLDMDELGVWMTGGVQDGE